MTGTRQADNQPTQRKVRASGTENSEITATEQEVITRNRIQSEIDNVVAEIGDAEVESAREEEEEELASGDLKTKTKTNGGNSTISSVEPSSNAVVGEKRGRSTRRKRKLVNSLNTSMPSTTRDTEETSFPAAGLKTVLPGEPPLGSSSERKKMQRLTASTSVGANADETAQQLPAALQEAPFETKPCDPVKQGRLKKIPSVASVLKEDNSCTECGVCLEAVKERGMLDTCDHVFCYPCILRWAKRASSCPHCKREVSVISKTDVTGKIVHSTFQVRKRNLRDTLDREELLRRRRQIQRSQIFRRPGHAHMNINQGHRQQRSSATPSSLQEDFFRNFRLNTDIQQLLTMHQMIRENVTRMSSRLTGLQANLNNLTFLNVGRSVVPQQSQLNFCNMPTFAANINVTVNGTPIGQPANVALSGYSVVDNSEYLPHPLFHYYVNRTDLRGLNPAASNTLNGIPQLQQQLQAQAQQFHQFANFSPPNAASFLTANGLIPQELGQPLDMLTRFGQAHLQQLAASMQPPTSATNTSFTNNASFNFQGNGQ